MVDTEGNGYSENIRWSEYMWGKEIKQGDHCIQN